MNVCQVMSAYVMSGNGSNLRLAVRVDEAGDCILVRDDFKILLGLTFLAQIMGEAHEIGEALTSSLETANINLTVAETLVQAGLKRVEDFPRWQHFVRPLSVSL